MLTVGVDLAAEPKGTAYAVIEWASNRAKLIELVLGADDSKIVRVAASASKIGIDCALGWPERFIDFLINHRSSEHVVSKHFGTIDWRRELSFRETDRRVRELTGRWPLSVATDRLGVTALRCAGLLARLGATGVDVDRSGLGDVVEIYPAGSLKLWQFDTSGYRASADVRKHLLEQILARAEWLDVSDFRELIIDSCDAFDAVVASLVTRAAALGTATLPSGNDIEVAQVEGWIALPTIEFADLARYRVQACSHR
jgi:predicted nuclease with RNAse H fold